MQGQIWCGLSPAAQGASRSCQRTPPAHTHTHTHTQTHSHPHPPLCVLAGAGIVWTQPSFPGSESDLSEDTTGAHTHTHIHTHTHVQGQGRGSSGHSPASPGASLSRQRTRPAGATARMSWCQTASLRLGQLEAWPFAAHSIRSARCACLSEQQRKSERPLAPAGITRMTCYQTASLRWGLVGKQL